MRERQRVACMPVTAKPARSKATLCMPAPKGVKRIRQARIRKRSKTAGGTGRAEREKEREQGERDSAARDEPPRRGGATPEARADAASATERNATRTHSRARGASGGPADGGRPREGGAEATAPAERSERKPARTAGAATRGGSDGRARASGEAGAQGASTPKEAPRTGPKWAEHGATGTGGRAPRSGASAGGPARRGADAVRSGGQGGRGADYDTPLPPGVH